MEHRAVKYNVDGVLVGTGIFNQEEGTESVIAKIKDTTVGLKG